LCKNENVVGSGGLLRDILEGRMKSKPTRGRKRLHMMSDVVLKYNMKQSEERLKME